MKMNPNAASFKPHQPKVESKPKATNVAWSNPAKSVMIAQLPRRNLSDEISKSGAIPKVNSEPRIMPQPVKLEDEAKEEGEWKKVTKVKNENLTEEELEVLREKRRERRKIQKQQKKIKKEGEKLTSLRANKDSRIKMMDSKMFQKFKESDQNSSKNLIASDKVKFFDEEYPSIGAASTTHKPNNVKLSPKPNITKKSESGSEWETEDESSEPKIDPKISANSEKIVKIEVISSQNEPRSFSSILKSKKVEKIENPVIKELQDVIANPTISEPKKAKRKDPITFDLFAALQNNKAARSKVKSSQGTVLGSKIQPQTIVRNALDSTAPLKRRGKEREKPKKKKLTKMKKLVQISREQRRARHEKLVNCAQVDKDEANNIDNCNSEQLELQQPEQANLEGSEIGSEERSGGNDVDKMAQSFKKDLEIVEDEPIEKARILVHSKKFRE